MIIAASCLLGYLLDLALGERFSAISPAVLFGKLIACLEAPLRKLCGPTQGGQRGAGVLLVVILCVIALVIPAALLYLCGLVHWVLRFLLETFMCYQILATRGLKDASMKVHDALVAGDLPRARTAVGMIVGRDTDALDEAGVTRAAVETVAENASDGCVAPLLFLIVGGAPLGMLYKAINTMDSMVGYRNETYRYFGTAAARLDDVVNWIPARLTALLVICSAAFLHMDAKSAWRIWRRDRRKHPSPNSAQSESAVAGALGVRLLGDASYFGKLVHKETIGDDTRAIEPADIVRANRLLYASMGICCVLGCALRVLIVTVC